ncbi:MAG: AraC family transcriptional regulator [Chlamydiales bacterium]|jgi:AraC family transcriptional regulator
MVQTHGPITLGRPDRTVDLAGLRLIESRYEPRRVLAPHAHRNGNVSLVFEGEFEESIDGHVVRPGSASFVVKPGGAIHSNRYGARPVRAFVIEITQQREMELGLRSGQPARWYDGGTSVAWLLDIYEAFLDEAHDLETVALDGLREVIRSTESVPSPGCGGSQLLRRAEMILRSEVGSAPDSRQLAERVGVHPVYLARLFRAAHGCGISAYRRRLQVRDAARRLAECPGPQTDVAIDAGFADQSHMCRAFKAELGLTPGAYRRLLQRAPCSGHRAAAHARGA